MSGLIAQILAVLCVSILKHLQGRADLKDSIRNELALEASLYAQKALAFKASINERPDRGATLRVQDPEQRVELPGSSSSSQGDTNGDQLHSQ